MTSLARLSPSRSSARMTKVSAFCNNAENIPVSRSYLVSKGHVALLYSLIPSVLEAYYSRGLLRCRGGRAPRQTELEPSEEVLELLLAVLIEVDAGVLFLEDE
jgi:hypothetical protein